jgi:DNA-directed RNA polymerase subunit RPC12/RpoP
VKPRPTKCEACKSKRLTFEYSSSFHLGGGGKPVYKKGQLICGDCGHRQPYMEKVEESS